jgi:hypothetical protein
MLYMHILIQILRPSRTTHLCKAKVRDLEEAGAVQQQVFGLEVAVDDVLRARAMRVACSAMPCSQREAGGEFTSNGGAWQCRQRRRRRRLRSAAALLAMLTVKRIVLLEDEHDTYIYTACIYTR